MDKLHKSFTHGNIDWSETVDSLTMEDKDYKELLKKTQAWAHEMVLEIINQQITKTTIENTVVAREDSATQGKHERKGRKRDREDGTEVLVSREKLMSVSIGTHIDSESPALLIYRGRLTDKTGDVHKDAVCAIRPDGKVNQIIFDATDESSPMFVHGQGLNLHYLFGPVSRQVLNNQVGNLRKSQKK